MDPSRMIEGILELTSRLRRQYQTYVKVRGQWAYLYKAIDKYSDTIEFHLSPTRNAKAAKRLLAKALRGLRASERPKVINNDKAPTYGLAIATLKRRASSHLTSSTARSSTSTTGSKPTTASSSA